jgi:UPF0716 family protein affecting phage T7 exclusion
MNQKEKAMTERQTHLPFSAMLCYPLFNRKMVRFANEKRRRERVAEKNNTGEENEKGEIKRRKQEKEKTKAE